jgi:hypothetical protein
VAAAVCGGAAQSGRRYRAAIAAVATKAGGKTDDPQAMEQLLKLMKALLLGKPEFTLDIQAKLSEGLWQSKLVLNFQGFRHEPSDAESDGMAGALEKGSADATVSKALLETELNHMSDGQAPQQLEE